MDAVPPEGFEPAVRYILKSSIAEATAALIVRLLRMSPPKQDPPNYEERDQRIRELYASGLTQAQIAAQFGISPRRVSSIIRGIHS